MNGDTFAAPVELKFTSDEAGEFEGYGSVFGNEDSHGDVIVTRAFADSLAEHKAQGTMPGLYIEHGPWMGGDRLPAGVWTSVEEDDKGLRCKGKISALDTDYGRRVRSLMQDGALRGLSIAFSVRPNGAVLGKKPRRLLKSVNLRAIDLVTSPSNAVARVEHVKMMGGLINPEKAAQCVAEAMQTVEATLKGGNAPTSEDRARMRQALMDAHEALTGASMPSGMKAKPTTIREFEAALRESGFSNAEARTIAESGFKTLSPRDEDEAKANAEAQAAARQLADYLASLTK